MLAVDRRWRRANANVSRTYSANLCGYLAMQQHRDVREFRFDVFLPSGIRYDNNTRIFIAAFVRTGFRLRVCINADARTNCVGARQGNFP